MKNLDFYYGMLTEGNMDLMFLPAGAVAWLWQYNRPQKQIDSASMFAKMANELGDPVADAALLRADHNVLVIHTEGGNKVSVYPDGGYGANGEPIEATPEGISGFLMGQSMEPEAAPMDPLPDDLDIEDIPPVLLP